MGGRTNVHDEEQSGQPSVVVMMLLKNSLRIIVQYVPRFSKWFLPLELLKPTFCMHFSFPASPIPSHSSSSNHLISGK
jgi:hypothetical protein